MNSDTPKTDAIKLTERGAAGVMEDLDKLACQLERENAELRKDAERYRWLREYGAVKGVIDWNVMYVEYQDLRGLDAAIDASKETGK